jgi:hypothetical protein
MPAMRRALLALAAGLVALIVVSPTGAQTGTFEPGEIFVSVGGGLIRVFDPAGTQIAELDTTTDSAEIGDMCFGNGAIYSMNYDDQSISRFNLSGELIEAVWADLALIPADPESCVLDGGGNLYVGAQSGQLLKLDADGTLIQTFLPETEDTGTDQIDLATDQCTMLYTSESAAIKQFDVCTGEQLPDFNTTAAGDDSCFNLRIRPNSEVFVACGESVFRFSSSGDLITSYEPVGIDPAGGGLFALNLDNDDKHFFTATYDEGRIWRIDIDTGEGTETPYITTTIAGDSIGGVAVFAEITVAAPGGFIDPDRPEIVQSVPDPTQISTEPDVIGTNVLFSVIFAIVILLSSQIFNETIEDNNKEIERFAKRYVRPLGAPFNSLRATWRSAFANNQQYSATAAIMVVLAATALVYGFLEPGFSLDKDGIILLISIVVALGAVTYAYSGMEARVTERRYKLPSGVRVYPVAFGIAIVSVVLSRFINFHPGVIYGFVASNVVLGVGDLAIRQKGQAVFLAAIALLATFGLAWAVMIPAREWAESDANPLAVILEASSTLIVVGAIESLAFTMVPIEFTHGIKVWRWSKVAWFGIAIVAAFLFWHVLLFQDNAGFKSVEHGKTAGAFIALGVCVGLTAGAWGFFKYRKSQAEKRAILPGAPPPEVGPPIIDETTAEPLPEAGIDDGGDR